MEFVRRVYENGKLTIPKELRELQDIQEGDFVRFQIVDVIRGDRPAAARPAFSSPALLGMPMPAEGAHLLHGSPAVHAPLPLASPVAVAAEAPQGPTRTLPRPPVLQEESK